MAALPTTLNTLTYLSDPLLCLLTVSSAEPGLLAFWPKVPSPSGDQQEAEEAITTRGDSGEGNEGGGQSSHSLSFHGALCWEWDSKGHCH